MPNDARTTTAQAPVGLERFMDHDGQPARSGPMIIGPGADDGATWAYVAGIKAGADPAPIALEASRLSGLWARFPIGTPDLPVRHDVRPRHDGRLGVWVALPVHDDGRGVYPCTIQPAASGGGSFARCPSCGHGFSFPPGYRLRPVRTACPAPCPGAVVMAGNGSPGGVY